MREKNQYGMEIVKIIKEVKRKEGNSPEILFEALGTQFKLLSLSGGKIKTIEVEEGYSVDGFHSIGSGKNRLFRGGRFTIEISVSIPQEKVVSDEELHRSRCGA